MLNLQCQSVAFKVHTWSLQAIGKPRARCSDPDEMPYQDVQQGTSYPKRRVDKNKIWWEHPCDEYNPTFYNNRKFLEKGKKQGWAHNDWDELSLADKQTILTSTLPVWDPDNDQVVFLRVLDACYIDDLGRPKNPLGRTGISGRGSLGKYGANHAADMIPGYFDPDTGEFYFLTIRRRDTCEVACAGGMIDPGDQAKVAKQATNLVIQTSKNAAAREIVEEAISEEGAAVLRETLADPNNTIVIAAGVVDDARNTDNAFMVSTAFLAIMDKETAMKIMLQKQNDEVEDVAWLTLKQIERDEKGVFASHMSFFKAANLKMNQLKKTNRLPGMMPSLKRSNTFVPDDKKRFKVELTVDNVQARFHNIGIHASYPFARR